MKTPKITLLLIVFFGLAFTCTSQNEEILVIDKDEFAFRISNEKSLQLIDVRTPEEFMEGYIDEAMNIDVNGSDFVKSVEVLDKESPVFIYCKSGGRSARAAELLFDMGFKEIYDLEGGYMKWVKN